MRLRSEIVCAMFAAALVFCSALPTASSQTTCDVEGADVRGGLVIVAVILGGIPTYFARDGRSDVGIGASTLGPEYDDGDDPLRLALEGSSYGGWGRAGYRVSWFDTSYPVDNCLLGHTNASMAFVLVPYQENGRELRISLGPGFGLMPTPAFSANLGLHYEQPLLPRVFFSVDAIYAPNLTEEENVRHASRLRAKVRWHAIDSVQPYLAVVGGTTDSGVVHMGEPVPDGTSTGRPGLYTSALLGLESRWGPAN